MSGNSGAFRFLHCIGGTLVLLWMLAPVAYADCLKDLGGEVYCGGGRCAHDGDGTVWCSRFYDGEAQRVRGGAVLCGKGMCEKDSRGELFCSSERGGAVTKDRHGHVRCFGRCEPGTPAYCENTRAGSSAAGGS